MKSYLVKGNEVVINRIRGDFACAWFAPTKGSQTIGWLRVADLDRPELLLDASENAWTGEWKYALNSIAITRNRLDGFLNIVGDAIWKGIGDNVHVGELDGRFAHKNGVLDYFDGNEEYDCKAKFNLLGKYLIVADNMTCGGVNVSFTGVYRLAKRY